MASKKRARSKYGVRMVGDTPHHIARDWREYWVEERWKRSGKVLGGFAVISKAPNEDERLELKETLARRWEAEELAMELAVYSYMKP